MPCRMSDVGLSRGAGDTGHQMVHRDGAAVPHHPPTTPDLLDPLRRKRCGDMRPKRRGINKGKTPAAGAGLRRSRGVRETRVS